jgi:RimJ/RimL family protein N-acetyltransferase
VPTPFASKPTLVGERATLRPFRAEDVEPMATALADPDVRRLTGSVHHPAFTVARLREWYATRNAQTDRLDLAIVDNATGRCVGEVVLNEWDEGNESCNFRILIGPDGQGRGLGTEATTLVLRHAFTVLGLHRVELSVYAFNPRAKRAYEKAGFLAEGVLRDALRLEDGQRVDAVVMAALAPHWLAADQAGTPDRATPDQAGTPDRAGTPDQAGTAGTADQPAAGDSSRPLAGDHPGA